MGNIVLSILLNGFMAALLLATIIYCWRLNNRIRVLQDSRSELARIIREFDESTRRATDSIAEIHAATSRLSENIQHKIDKANYLATDLEMMIEKGNRMAGRPAEPAPTQSAPSRRPEPMGRPSRSEMEAVAGNVAGVTPLADAPTGGRPRPTNRPRSRAEQELLNVLKANNTDESGR